MTSLRSQLFIGLLVFTAIMGFGAYYLRETSTLIQQMPPESIQFIKNAQARFQHNKKNALRAAGVHLGQHAKKIKQFFQSEQNPPKKSSDNEPSN